MPFYEIHKRQQAERLADRRKNGLPQQTRFVCQEERQDAHSDTRS